MGSWGVLNDAVLKQDEGFVRGLFSEVCGSVV